MPASLVAELRATLPNATIWDAAELASRDPGFDARNFGASALVRPADTAGVAALPKFCAERGIGLVAQGGR
ncbi:MAG: FAD-binding oxidoreductase, partial [Mesorhizobium sp.]